ncbi:hypothetical protein GCM10008098_29420 [Rhodanobacter panaciterrae]|uniref:Tail specific protease domain-containing protein n=1 Tax=Rhodanobacter panaciterrae TaxID=490572 RepID=A0ABQ3A3S9_9GAMM|nr:S41 family peptidase [Rhodanobacter panaciterrae]GGY34362.1 hypothetical protein GCM10008098_29420 [Rhodanobacter panaciterrae]
MPGTGGALKYYESEPALASLRDEPRFQALLATLRANNRLWADTAFATPAGSMPDEAHRIAGLSLFWSQAKYNFVYFDHVPGLDWDQVYLDFLPKVMAAKSLHNYYDVLMRLAPLLHDGHTNIYPPVSIQDEFYANPALTTGLVEGHVLVLAVNSPRVAVAGVHVGDEIVSIDGMEVRRYAEERVAPYVSSSTSQDRAVRMYTYGLLHGDHRQPVTLGLRDAAGRMRTATLSREQDPDARPRSMFQWQLLKGDIAYLSLDEFADDRAVKAFEQAWPQIRQARGLILDVRRNGGGSSRPGQIILSYLSQQPVPGAHSTTRIYSPAAHANGETWMSWRPLPDTDEPFEQKHAEHFNGPVAMLIGPRTFSAAEDFAMMFDAMQRGVLVGETTGGSTGSPLQFDLPGGGKARICAKRDVYPDGHEFVGKGIAPDIAVAPTMADIHAGRDPVLEHAVAVLRKSASAASPSRRSKS